jgi:hypothetical protein
LGDKDKNLLRIFVRRLAPRLADLMAARDPQTFIEARAIALQREAEIKLESAAASESSAYPDPLPIKKEPGTAAPESNQDQMTIARLLQQVHELQQRNTALSKVKSIKAASVAAIDNTSTPAAKAKCTICKRPNHTADVCWFRPGASNENPFNQQQQSRGGGSGGSNRGGNRGNNNSRGFGKRRRRGKFPFDNRGGSTKGQGNYDGDGNATHDNNSKSGANQNQNNNQYPKAEPGDHQSKN